MMTDLRQVSRGTSAGSFRTNMYNPVVHFSRHASALGGKQFSRRARNRDTSPIMCIRGAPVPSQRVLSRTTRDSVLLLVVCRAVNPQDTTPLLHPRPYENLCAMPFSPRQVVLLGGQGIWYEQPVHSPQLDQAARQTKEIQLRRELRLRLDIGDDRCAAAVPD